MRTTSAVVVFVAVLVVLFAGNSSTSGILDEVVSQAETMVCPNSGAPCHSKLILAAAGLVAGGVAIGYLIGSQLAIRRARCNTQYQLSTDKVVDTVDIEDVGDKKVFCRCWKSKAFPLCDGSHNAHNKSTGDNVGPLIVKGKAA